MKKQEKYIHTGDLHNLSAPNIIVPDLVDFFHPGSVVDIGCGIGTFLSVFLKSGIDDVLGIDGNWVDRDKLYIDPKYFQTADLEQPITFERNFDVALCLEVVEHLQSEAAEQIVDTLCGASKLIVFSAAIPGQGGINHLNEQPFEYWQAKFKTRGYYFFDLFRERYWTRDEVDYWYSQNMFLVVHESVDLPPEVSIRKIEGPAKVYIHPIMFKQTCEELERLNTLLNDLKSPAGIVRTLHRVFRSRILKPLSHKFRG
jgi:SAM-dependent methyltransferase